MLARIARLLLRIVGWLLTPLAITAAAAIGATALATIAPQFSTGRALIITAVGGLLGAVLGFWGWTKLLQRSHGLREVLQVTSEGVPTQQGLDEVVGRDEPGLPPETEMTQPPPGIEESR